MTYGYSAEKIRSLEALMEEARWGKLTQNELDYVVQRTKSIDPDTTNDDEGWDLVKLIYIIGNSGAHQYRQLVEKFLHFRSNEMVCDKALWTLCRYWGLTKEYLDDVKLYIRGVEWAPTFNVRIAALSIAGEFLRKEYDRELLQLLLDVFEKLGNTDQIKDDDDHSRYLIQASAYSAIARAMGKKPFEIDDNGVERAILEGDFDSLDLSMIQKAHQMVEKKL